LDKVSQGPSPSAQARSLIQDAKKITSMVQHEQGADRNTKDDGPSIYSC
jgi:hypothetical protein